MRKINHLDIYENYKIIKEIKDNSSNNKKIEI